MSLHLIVIRKSITVHTYVHTYMVSFECMIVVGRAINHIYIGLHVIGFYSLIIIIVILI